MTTGWHKCSTRLKSFWSRRAADPPFSVRLTTAGIRHIHWNTQLLKRTFTARNTKGYIQTKPRWVHAVDLVLLLWGAVVIALHVHTNMKPPLPGCIPEVHPMAGARPACFAVDFDCHMMNTSGSKDEVHSGWEKFERAAVVKLRILHCQAFEMPTSLQDFHLLQEIRVYNSTIRSWTEDAALTNTNHPRLTNLSMVRTKMAAGVLPLGLQSSDFPSGLLNVYFCETNLREIPNDIDTKWHIGSNVYLENSQLSAVPPALIRLQLYYLNLAGNPISEAPAELFESTDMLYLMLARTNISSLPRTVPFPTPSPPFIDLSYTNISSFWAWIDPLVESMLEFGTPMIAAGGSVYCSDLEQIMSGASNAFSAPFEADLSPLLMDPSQQNWGFLGQAVDCSPPLFRTVFPLGDWDEMYSLD